MEWIYGIGITVVGVVLGFAVSNTLSKKDKRQHLIDDCDIELVHCCKNDDIIARVDGASAKRVWKAGRELRMTGGVFPENVLNNENGVCAETEKKIRERYHMSDQKPKPTPHSPKRTVHDGESFFRSIGEAAIDKSMSNRTAHNLKRVLERDSIIGYREVVSKMLRDRQCLDSINGRADISKTTRGEQKTEDDNLVDVGGVPVPFSTIKAMRVEGGEIVEVEIKCGNDYNYSNETIEPNEKGAK